MIEKDESSNIKIVSLKEKIEELEKVSKSASDQNENNLSKLKSIE